MTAAGRGFEHYPMEKKKIVIIGCGQIGSRHLQSLAAWKRPLSIEAVEPDPGSRQRAMDRFEDALPEGGFAGDIQFFEAVDSLDESIDLAIIATNSRERFQALERLLQHSRVKYLILEKFLFLRPEDYGNTERILREEKVTAWVNCPRRIFPFYSELKGNIPSQGSLTMTVSGSHLNLASNGIHFLDLFSFFRDTCEFDYDGSRIERRIFPSKRPGYVEFYGALDIGNSGNRLSIISWPEGDAPVSVWIDCPGVRTVIQETRNPCAFKGEATSGWNFEKKAFEFPLQSSMTSRIAEEIFRDGECGLTPFEISDKLHRGFLRCIAEIYNEIMGKESGICPIS